MTPRQFQYRARLVARDMFGPAAAIDNLRICLLKLADRADKAMANRAADELLEAARLLGAALGRIDDAKLDAKACR